ncbi:hypothetical protein HK096_006421, partial [Nowakowskiella sp. JEL0078]
MVSSLSTSFESPNSRKPSRILSLPWKKKLVRATKVTLSGKYENFDTLKKERNDDLDISPITPLPTRTIIKDIETAKQVVHESFCLIFDSVALIDHCGVADSNEIKIALEKIQIWEALTMELSFTIAKNSEVIARGAQDNVKRIALAAGVLNWDDFDIDDASKLCLLGDKHIFGLGSVRSYDLAYKRYQAAANLNHARAYLMLGNMNEYGLGTKKDLTQAQKYYNAATTANNDEKAVAEAYNCLGKIYQYAKGIQFDILLAEKMYRSSIEQGSLDGMTNLGILLEKHQKNFTEAFLLYQKAAKSGYSRAQNALGSCYFKGKGVKPDFGIAVDLFSKSAEQGNINAVNNLGICYESGLGVPRDFARAKSLYFEGVNQLHPSATNNAGYILLLEKQYEEAIRLFHVAEALGSMKSKYLNFCSLDATLNLGMIYELGCPTTFPHDIVSPDELTAMRYYNYGIKKGHIGSMVRLSQILIHSKLNKDLKKAENLLRHASQISNSSVAQTLLGQLIIETEKIKEEPLMYRLNEATEWLQKAADSGYSPAKVKLAELFE